MLLSAHVLVGPCKHLQLHETNLRGMCWQIHTSKQCATGVVHMYPFPLLRDRLFSMLATERGEPSVQDILNDSSKSDLQHVAEWQHVIDYLETVTLSNLEVHVPLIQAMTGPVQSGRLPTEDQQLSGIPPRAI